MEHHTSSKRSTQAYEAACEWFVEFRTTEPSEATRKAFLAWMQESPAHMAAYLEVAALWSDTAAINGDRRWTIGELTKDATRELANIVSLEAAGSATTPAHTQSAVAPTRRTGLKHRIRVWSLAAAAFIFAFVLAGLVQSYIQRGVYSTDIGEQRSITLTDGSTVQLNSRSKLRVDYTEDERRIELIRGQALFQVARDPSRPFIVSSDNTRVRALGTQFDIYQKTQGIVVTVLEGKVAVFDGQSAPRSADSVPSARESRRAPTIQARDASTVRVQRSGQPIYLTAGQQLALTSTEGSVPKAVNLSAATAWTQHQLIFESTPLSEVAEEFNRYNRRQLVIRDHALEGFRIDGVFSSTDPASLVRFLRARAGVEVSETDSAILLDHKTKSR